MQRNPTTIRALSLDKFACCSRTSVGGASVVDDLKLRGAGCGASPVGDLPAEHFRWAAEWSGNTDHSFLRHGNADAKDEKDRSERDLSFASGPIQYARHS